jgi:hypothetical protein
MHSCAKLAAIGEVAGSDSRAGEQEQSGQSVAAFCQNRELAQSLNPNLFTGRDDCAKHRSAAVRAFERENGGRQRRPPNNPYQHLRLFLPVYVAFLALRAAIPMLQVFKFGCAIAIFRELTNASAPLRPCPGWGNVALRLSPSASFRTVRFS